MAIKNALLGGTDNVNGDVIDAGDVNDTNDALAASVCLGEVKMFALSMSGAYSKANLQTRGWAICDGTTPATQGITSPTITTTPNLEHTFIRMSDDESSGGTGGADTHTLTTAEMPSHRHTLAGHNDTTAFDSGARDGYVTDSGTLTTNSVGSGDAHNNLPTYYELAYFMKVKI